MKDFISLIKSAQADNENAMLEIIDAFEPLIVKYTSYMGYNEDVHSELVLKLISFVKTIDLDKLRCQNNYVIVDYIEKTIRNEYIALSKGQNRTKSHEVHFEYEDFVNISETKDSLQDSLHDKLIYDIMKSVLTEREFLCVDLVVLQGYTAEQVGERLGITKQAVNQCKKRGLNKLKSLFKE